MRIGLKGRILAVIGGGVLATVACGNESEADRGADASTDAPASGGASGGGGAGGGGGTGGSVEQCLDVSTIAAQCSTESCGEGWTYTCSVFGGGTWDPDAGIPCPDTITGGCCESFSLPVQKNGACCYHYYANPGCGRPFVVGGRLRYAEPQARRDWSGDSRPASADGLDASTSTALAKAWAEDALMEHASIGSFAAFTLSLLAFGAPAELVASAHRAGLDEIEHAQLCFALARRYGGADTGPGPITMRGECVPGTLAEAAASAVAEGCVAETVAAALAAEQATAATDAAAKAALSRIAEDEARHAELAWGFVVWALGRGGAEVERAVAVAFARAIEQVKQLPAPGLAADVSEAAWRTHGRLTPGDSVRVRAAALAEVIEPCARALQARARERLG